MSVGNTWEYPKYCKYEVMVKNSQVKVFEKVIEMLNAFESSQKEYKKFEKLFEEVLEELKRE